MTLTEVSFYSRKAAPFAILGVLVMLIFFYAFKLMLIALQGTPVQTLYTNPVFGKIKKPYIKEASSSSGMTFVMDTVEGQPVTASESAKVYFLTPTVTRFGYKEKITLVAKTFGFDTALIKYRLVDKDAVFVDSKQKLSIDITNFNYTYQYNFASDLNVFQSVVIPSETEIVNKAIEFLNNVGRYPEELAKGKTNIVYLIYNADKRSFDVTERPQDANAVEIDFYRPDIDGFPIVSPTYFNSQNYVVMVPYDEGVKVLKAQIKFFEKSESQIGVYALKSGDEAWKELQEGKGMVVSNMKGQTNISVKKMFTGYLDPGIYQDYLQPIYVFLGENNFVGYIPAISNSFISE